MTDIWPYVFAERGALAADLTNVTDEQWATESLCSGWTVQDLVAHLTATASTNPVGFVTGLAKAKFKFNEFTNNGVAQHSGATGAETLAAFEKIRNSTTCPPGPKTSWLGEVLVHSEDIRRPLGIRHDYPYEALKQAANFYAGSNALIGGKKRISGLSLKATDTNWEHGDGELRVEGPMLSLLMAITGRAAHAGDLTGDGAMRLRTRCNERASDAAGVQVHTSPGSEA